MKDLIEALQILQKYCATDNSHPTNCSHDEFRVFIDEDAVVSDEDKVRLDKLGFFPSEEDCDACFLSFRFGSC